MKDIPLNAMGAVVDEEAHVPTVRRHFEVNPGKVILVYCPCPRALRGYLILCGIPFPQLELLALLYCEHAVVVFVPPVHFTKVQFVKERAPGSMHGRQVGRLEQLRLSFRLGHD